jgi:hypothetical protein
MINKVKDILQTVSWICSKSRSKLTAVLNICFKYSYYKKLKHLSDNYSSVMAKLAGDQYCTEVEARRKKQPYYD